MKCLIICSFSLICRYISLTVSQGSGTHLALQKLLQFQLSNMHSFPFPGIFFFKNLNLNLCWYITQIYFNMKDSGYFDQFVLLIRFADTLVSKSGGLGPQKLLHF